MTRRMIAAAACCLLVPMFGCAMASNSGVAADERRTVDADPGRLSAEQALARVRAALDGVAEVASLRRRLEESGDALAVMLEGDADPSTDRPRVWQVYVGESHPDHLVRLWAFNVDAVTGAISITDPVTLEDLPYDLWRQRLAQSPP
ncbi:MAG: hypothetical protein CVU56_11710 [Deltaproteobacteria bacterium HGW-Deltaproteobacteria-14]|jgi:hypothetical protein|nr:MAG: hypothetical protein CVU56_11710 [Deltaproteobacteria bacterium HGW-Deltaproteobacteria-14]